jgi:hypothetical protein
MEREMLLVLVEVKHVVAQATVGIDVLLGWVLTKIEATYLA